MSYRLDSPGSIGGPRAWLYRVLSDERDTDSVVCPWWQEHRHLRVGRTSGDKPALFQNRLARSCTLSLGYRNGGDRCSSIRLQQRIPSRQAQPPRYVCERRKRTASCNLFLLFHCRPYTFRFHPRTIILNQPNTAWVSRLAIAVLRQGSNQHFRLVYSAILLPGLSGPIAVLLFVFFEL